MVLSPFRLKKGKQLEKEEAINEVKKNIHLIKAPHAGKKFYTRITPCTNCLIHLRYKQMWLL